MTTFSRAAKVGKTEIKEEAQDLILRAVSELHTELETAQDADEDAEPFRFVNPRLSDFHLEDVRDAVDDQMNRLANRYGATITS